MTMDAFVKSPFNPIYGGPSTGTLFDVLVTRDSGKYRMDFSWRPQKSLAVSFSDDGVHWDAPRITLGPDLTTGWEDNLNRSAVIKTDRGYTMWYTGQARGYSFIGCAESEDGLTFRRIGREPVLISERLWEGQSVMNPCVLYENGVYRMWYAAGETYEPNVLAYAESKDGLNWTKARINPIFVKDTSREFEQDRVGGCQVLRHPTLGYIMFYIGYRDIDTACICCACSPDGVTRWKRYAGGPMVSPDGTGWDGDACYKPSALYIPEADEWRIWYNGRHEHDEFVGMATRKGDFKPSDFI